VPFININIPPRIDVYEHSVDEEALSQKLDQVLAKLDDVQAQLTGIRGKEEAMTVELDTLTEQVKKNEEVEQSAVLLIQGIAAQLAAIKDDPVKIAALSTELQASADTLASAVAANTPAA
jgi:predicted  nucleic acid-binding Zn-ribbon protein